MNERAAAFNQPFFAGRHRLCIAVCPIYHPPAAGAGLVVALPYAHETVGVVVLRRQAAIADVVLR